MVAALSGVLSITAAFFYIRDIVQTGETKPNAVSFFLWTVLGVIAVVAQFKAGASWSIVIVIGATMNTLIITVIALIGYGYRAYGKVDLYCFVLAVLAIGLWQLTGNPVVAIAFVIVGDVLASWPTVSKTYREPQSEHVVGWLLITLASALSVISTEILDAANLAYPIYLLLMNGTIFSLAYLGRKVRR